MYYKILKKDMLHYSMQYKEGINVDVEPFDPRPKCGGGLFFSDEKNILAFCNYGDLIAEVTVPEGEMIVPVENKYKANKIILSDIRNLWTKVTFEYLVSKGVNLHADYDCALIWAAREGHLEVVKYLKEQSADIHADDDYALRWSAENSHLEVANYLVEQGAELLDIDIPLNV